MMGFEYKNDDEASLRSYMKGLWNGENAVVNCFKDFMCKYPVRNRGGTKIDILPADTGSSYDYFRAIFDSLAKSYLRREELEEENQRLKEDNRGLRETLAALQDRLDRLAG